MRPGDHVMLKIGSGPGIVVECPYDPVTCPAGLIHVVWDADAHLDRPLALGWRPDQLVKL
jgi:hypothetical protein